MKELDTTCSADIHRRWKNEGCHEQQVRSRTNQMRQKPRTSRRVVSELKKFEKLAKSGQIQEHRGEWSQHRGKSLRKLVFLGCRDGWSESGKVGKLRK